MVKVKKVAEERCGGGGGGVGGVDVGGCCGEDLFFCKDKGGRGFI